MPKTDAPPPWEALLYSDNLPRDLAKLYDEPFLARIAALANARVPAASLREGVEEAARAYLLARRDMRKRQPGKLAHRRIEAVADTSYALARALERLEVSPNPQLKVAEALERLSQDRSGRGAHLLRIIQTWHGPGDPMRALREISDALAEVSAELVGKAPGDPRDGMDARGAITHLADLAAWRERPVKTETVPVRAMAADFRTTWQACSFLPYTEGKHDKRRGGTKSPAVDAVHMIGLALDPDLSRSRVVTAFRDLPPA
ncbi:hypothetical protein O5O51_04885 [Sinirhodobacter sp. HNIBRBA609]|nr:hypothetical protein O5O51_04885 [Sinirhodobacter sp. HNIBRBA609]